jgi:hypothetical protein
VGGLVRARSWCSPLKGGDILQGLSNSRDVHYRIRPTLKQHHNLRWWQHWSHLFPESLFCYSFQNVFLSHKFLSLSVVVCSLLHNHSHRHLLHLKKRARMKMLILHLYNHILQDRIYVDKGGLHLPKDRVGNRP